MAADRAREAWWRKAVQRRRRAVKRSNTAANRRALKKAESALRKVRARQAAAWRPRIRTAAQVGLRFRYLFGNKGPVYRGAGHYTADARAKNMADLVAKARVYERLHPGGVAYEALVADNGDLLLANPMDRKGAAVAVNNTGMVNICCPGTTGDRLTAAQKQTIRWLLGHWHTSAVPAPHRLPRAARGLEWRGHREYPSQSTACPGAMLADYRDLWS